MNPSEGNKNFPLSFQQVIGFSWLLTSLIGTFPILLWASSNERNEANEAAKGLTQPHPAASPSVAVARVSPLPPSSQVDFDRIEGDTIYFKGEPATIPPEPIKTSYTDLNYLGALRPEKGSPYFLFSGKPCSETVSKRCLEEQAIFSIRPNRDKPVQFTYPGKIVDPEKGQVVSESRAFFGKCLNRKSDQFVKFQREVIERKRRRARIQESVLIEEAAEDHFHETFLEGHKPSLTTTLKYVRSKQCKEIEGRNRQVSSLVINIHPDDEDDDSENQDAQDADPQKEGSIGS